MNRTSHHPLTQWLFARFLGPNAAFRRLGAGRDKIEAMKLNLLAASAFAAALAMPLAASAQQGPPQGQGPATRASAQMPSEARLQQRWGKRLGRLNLSSDQQQHIQSLIHQYSQSHPEGSPRDRDSVRQLRQQLMGQLTPDQQNQLRQERRAHRAQMRERAQQGGYQQGAPDQQYQQQGNPDQQYQQGPPQQYQQGPPQQYQQGPPQQYQQGPPDQQYQQGPPPEEQGPPPNEQGPPPA